MRAVLFAKTTATSILGLRANILASHGSIVSPRRIACRTTAVAPVINNRGDHVGPSSISYPASACSRSCAAAAPS